jgi:cobalamin biosynthetic protein CobC
LDAAITRYGGERASWIDLSTGINPNPYPIGEISGQAWTALPDDGAMQRVLEAARDFWGIPSAAQVLAAPGASALIARLPGLWPVGRVRIDSPTYNEHAAAFAAHGWSATASASDVRVVVHPNNPTGALWDGSDAGEVTIIDESFCDTCPERSLVKRTCDDTIVLKSFGKFWGLAGLRLGFAIGPEALITRLSEMLGPWPVSGPALEVGARALTDRAWADATRNSLAEDAARLDRLVTAAGGAVVGGTPLFRLYDMDDASAWQARLAEAHIWSRIFPYSDRWLRLGLPPADGWARLEAAL